MSDLNEFKVMLCVDSAENLKLIDIKYILMRRKILWRN